MRLVMDSALLLAGALTVIWGAVRVLGAWPRSLLATGDPKVLDLAVSSKVLMWVTGVEIAIGTSVVQYVMASSDSAPTVSRTYVGTVIAVLGSVATFALVTVASGAARQLALGTLVAAALGLWIVWPSWLTTDILGALLALAMIVACVRLTLNFGFVTLILGALFVHDIISVYITGSMIKMTKASIGAAGEPIARMIPSSLISPEALALDAGLSRQLGWGDVILPGILIAIASVFARRHRKMSIAYAAFAGYGIGLILVVVLLGIMNRMQPALLTLYPCIMAGILFAARRAGLLKALFAFRHKPRNKPRETRPEEN